MEYCKLSRHVRGSGRLVPGHEARVPGHIFVDGTPERVCQSRDRLDASGALFCLHVLE
jgi:hypothetical protein